MLTPKKALRNTCTLHISAGAAAHTTRIPELMLRSDFHEQRGGSFDIAMGKYVLHLAPGSSRDQPLLGALPKTVSSAGISTADINDRA